MIKQNIYRGCFYILSLFVLALGITLNTKAGLGVSPIISVSYSISTILNANFGNMTLILYCIFVIVEMLLHTRRHYHLKKNKKESANLKLQLLKDALQFPLSLVFTRFMNIFVALIPACEDVGADTFYGSFAGRIGTLFIAIVLTGIGAAVSLNMRLIPNPGDGIVQAISDTIGKEVGFVKNYFDLFNITLTACVGMLFAGQFIGIGIGTVVAVIGVGRVIAVFNHFLKGSMAKLAGVDD